MQVCGKNPSKFLCYLEVLKVLHILYIYCPANSRCTFHNTSRRRGFGCFQGSLGRFWCMEYCPRTFQSCCSNSYSLRQLKVSKKLETLKVNRFVASSRSIGSAGSRRCYGRFRRQSRLTSYSRLIVKRRGFFLALLCTCFRSFA